MARNTQNTREQILVSAYALFLKKGIDSTTTREIARAAGVNEVTLFRRFANKEGLVGAVIERFTPAVLAAHLEKLKWTGDLEEDLYRLTRMFMDLHRSQEAFFRFIFVNLPRPEQRPLFKRIPVAFHKHGRQFFSGPCRGTGLDPAAVSAEFAAPIVLRTIRRIFTGSPFPFPSDERFARTHAALFARALLCRKKDRS